MFNDYDADTTLDIMNSAGLDAVEGEFTTGTLINDKNRPLKVKFDFESTAFDLLAKTKNLKDNGQIFIVPDHSREQRIEHRKLVEQLKLIRSQNPKKGVIFGTKPSIRGTADISCFQCLIWVV